jgi:hypothetical protein
LNRDNIWHKRTYGKLENELLPKSPLIELGGRQWNGLIQREKPFDVLAEGLISENSRGDKTAIELFVAGVRGWGSWRWLQLENSQST